MRAFCRGAFALALLSVALVACRDTTAPPPPDLEVMAAISQMFGPGFTSDQNGREVTCELHLVATTKGTGSAKWQGATFRLFIGKNHATPLDTAWFITQDVADSWGGDSITAGTSQTSTWTVTVSFPFSGEFEFRYVGRSGKVKTTTVPFSCGPAITADTPGPTIAGLTLTPSSGELEAGHAPMKVSFQVTAPAGLWQTEVELRGPCKIDTTLEERLATTTLTRELTFNIPGSCDLGVPITVAATVLDAATQLAVRTVNSTVVLADHERPTIDPLFFPLNGNTPQSTPSGDYFTGDSIVIWSTGAHDNHRVAAVVREVLPFGVRDSLLPGYPPDGWLHIRPEWTQNIQLKMWARDEVGLVSDTVLTPRDSIRIHPTVERPTRTATLDGDTRDVVIDSRAHVAYLRQVDQHRIVVFSLDAMQVTSMLVLPAAANGFDLTPSGDSLLFVVGDRLGVIDTRQSPLAVTEVALSGVDVPSGEAATSVLVASNGRAYVMISAPASAKRRLLEIDLATGAQRVRADAGVNGIFGFGPMERSLDRSVLLVNLRDLNCLQRFDVRANVFSACVTPPLSFLPLTLDLTGQRAAMGLATFDASLQRLPPLAGVLPTLSISVSALSADGETLLVNDVPLGVVRVRTSDGAILDRTTNPVRPQMMRVSPDGAFLVSVDGAASSTTRISVIDLR
jgi:hypothetical protein